MNEIKELEQKIYGTISRIELALSDNSVKSESINHKRSMSNNKFKDVEKENSLLKEKLLLLKKEHEKDLDSLNKIIRELNSILGEGNV